MQRITLKRLHEVWGDIPIIVTIGSEDEQGQRIIHVQVRPDACINCNIEQDYILEVDHAPLSNRLQGNT